jgi:hypothetical protein
MFFRPWSCRVLWSPPNVSCLEILLAYKELCHVWCYLVEGCAFWLAYVCVEVFPKPYSNCQVSATCSPNMVMYALQFWSPEYTGRRATFCYLTAFQRPFFEGEAVRLVYSWCAMCGHWLTCIELKFFLLPIHKSLSCETNMLFKCAYFFTRAICHSSQPIFRIHMLVL